MSRFRPAAPDAGLVPVGERMLYMQVFRVVTAAIVLGFWWLLPERRGMAIAPLLIATATYLAASAAGTALRRADRARALRAFGVTILVDGIYLALVSYGTAGMSSPLMYLILLHLIAVALLASFRTGMKLAFWHSLLLYVDFRLQQAGYLHPLSAADAQVAPSRVVLFGTVFWLVALATASFSAVNERELRRRSYDMEALARLSWKLENSVESALLAQTLVDAVAENFDLGRVVLATATGGGPWQFFGHRLPVPPGDPSRGDPAEDRIVRDALTARRTRLVLAADPESDPWLARSLPGARKLGIVPMYAEGAPVGVLVFEDPHRRSSRIERRVVEMIERFASQTALALANAWLLEQVQKLATTDALTSLANRRTFEDAMERAFTAACRGGRLSVVMVDIDRFKQINDQYGHQVGDEVLRAVSAAIRDTCRRTDLPARYGGEEFIVLLPDTGQHEALTLAEQIRAAIGGTAHPVGVTASLGVATFPDHAGTAEALVTAADRSLYVAKDTGRNRSVVADALLTRTSGGGSPAAPAR